MLSYKKKPNECVMNYNERKKTVTFSIIIVSPKTEVPGFDSPPRGFSWYLQHSRLKNH